MLVVACVAVALLSSASAASLSSARASATAIKLNSTSVAFLGGRFAKYSSCASSFADHPM